MDSNLNESRKHFSALLQSGPFFKKPNPQQTFNFVDGMTPKQKEISQCGDHSPTKQKNK